MTFFTQREPIAFEGPDSRNPLAFRYYDPDQVIAGKTLAEHLRFAVCYWHNFVWPGTDPFGWPTFDRPWFGEDLDHARAKADVAFEMFRLLRVPFFCFHDADVRPEGKTFAESADNLAVMTDYLAQKMETSDTKLLWGTANLFSHPRFMAGAATNPDPDVFAFAAATVKACLDATHKLGGANYVLWGGREGYETLLNTNLKQELDQLARFLHLVIDYKHKIGFTGTILIEPKPQEPTKHQYDYDVATIYGFLVRHGLDQEVRLNIEQGHAFLAGHAFEHELALACDLGIFGSIDMNRNDLQSGWDTDQFPNNVAEVALAYYMILRAGGFTTGGTNFDAKLRRQSTDPDDLLYAHIGGMDTCAKGLTWAAAMLEDGELAKIVQQRYEKWQNPEAQKMIDGTYDLSDITSYVTRSNLDPVPVSGRQEFLENLVNRYDL
ncbi:MAG: xylose isomerase [Pseudomonadota bacterium]